MRTPSASAPGRRARRRARVRTVRTLVLLVLAFLAVVRGPGWVDQALGRPDGASLAAITSAWSRMVDAVPITVVDVPADQPEVLVVEPPHDHPETPAPTSAPDTGAGGYEFSALQDDGTTPVTWSSCASVEVVVKDAPAGTEDLLRKALDQVGAATGLELTLTGTTDEPVVPERAARQDRYGPDWAPLLVAWTTPEEDPSLEGRTLGMGGATASRTSTDGVPDGPWVYVTGEVRLDAPELTEMLESGRDDEVLAVVTHELAHAMGLGHVDDPSSLMNPVLVPGVTTFSEADLEGLAALGSGACA